MSDESDWIEVREHVPCPIAARLMRKIAERSRQGALEYGSASILSRLHSAAQFRREKHEEAIDYLIYEEAELAADESPRSTDEY